MAVDPKTFKAPFISKKELWRKAEEFRKAYSENQIPVDVLSIVDFDLALDIIPIKSLKRDCDAEAALFGNLKSIAVDSDTFLDPRYESRLRFSIAHEIGHLVLHRDVFQAVAHATINDWVQFYQDLPDSEYRFLEYHANEFAGRLLVPLEMLTDLTNQEIARAKAGGLTNMDYAKEYIADTIAPRFGVSPQVIVRRLDKEESVWPLN